MLRRRHRTVLALTAGAMLISNLIAPVASVAEAPSGSTAITVFLEAPDEAALVQLAGSEGMTRSQRVSAVSRLVPGEDTHRQVEGALRAEGFTIVGATSWSVSATGPAARAARLFGTRPSLGKNPDASRAAAATGPLPLVPAALSAVVAAVYPTREGPSPFRHASTTKLDGHDLRNADTPANVAPSTGLNDTGATIATLQLADFFGSARDTRKNAKAADLTSYAVEHGLKDPVASGQYKAIKVDGGPLAKDDDAGGDIEVNLDQESILSTAPTANQHAYFAPGTEAGYDDVFANVYDDVVGNSHATAADPHIVAMSVSWGLCESQTGADAIATLEPILNSLVAAGVTVFASTGDDGIYDCGSGDGTGTDNNQADVDYPASSPSVVGVGGSRLSASTSAPNTGTNWTEKAWSCATPTACQSENGTGGGGGGASGSASADSDFRGFAAPAYQKVAIADVPFKGNVKRLVPDITADGDPATGFSVYTSNPDQAPRPGIHDVTIGGTSLASPISAAQLTNTLADTGRKTGVGSIHGALYSAYAQTRSLASTDPKRVFRDVTSGTNGAAKNRGTDPLTTAQVGYDTVSGLGGVLWSALVPYLLNQHRPSTSASMSLPKLHSKSWASVTAAWRVTRTGDPTLLGPTSVRITRFGSSTPVYSGATLASSHTFTGVPGATYRVTAVGQDLSGHRSASAVATISVPVDDSLFEVSANWSRAGGSSDIGGSHLVATKKSATATVSRAGRVYRLNVRTGPGSGKLGVYLSGKRIATLNLRSALNRHDTVTIYTSTSHALRTFTFRALSAPVSIDGLYVTY